MNEENAIRILSDIKSVFDKNEVIFWLDLGTLLGAVRDGKLISWDCNLNLSVLVNSGIETRNFALSREELEKNGFLFVDWGHDTAPSLIKNGIEVEVHTVRFCRKKFRYKSIVPIGFLGRTLNFLIWITYLVDPSVREEYGFSKRLALKSENIAGTLPNSIRKTIRSFLLELYLRLDTVIVESEVPESFFSSFREIEFHGLRFRIPSEYNEYLTFRYGDWKRPSDKYVGGAVKRRYRYGGKELDSEQIYGREVECTA